MTDKELLRLIGTTPSQDIVKAMETRRDEKGSQVMKMETHKAEKPGKYARKKHSAKLILIAAAVTISLLVGTAVAAVYYRHSLIENLNVSDPEGYEQLLVTAPQEEVSEAVNPNAEPELTPLTSARDDVAEYQVLEAILDSESLYTHSCIKPLQEDVFLISEWVEPDSPLEALENPEITGDGTVQEYADSLGKKLMRGRLMENFNGELINGWGVRCVTQTDGSMHLYGQGDNPGKAKKLPLTFEGVTYSLEDQSPILDRTVLELTLEDKSSGDQVVYTKFRAYDPASPDIENDFGYVIDSLTMKKTELGIYATFTYHATDELLQQIEQEIAEAQKVEYEPGEKNEDGIPMDLLCAPDYIRSQHLIGFIMLDENGEYFKVAGPDGASGIVDNGDGTYSDTYPMVSMESTADLKFRVLTGDLNKVGTYAFSK